MSRRGRSSLSTLLPDHEQIVVATSHFTVSDDCAKQLEAFAAENRMAKRTEFKSAWNSWIQRPEISSILSAEIANLDQTGFKGDAMDKLYVSVRYYYRKKSLKRAKNDGGDGDGKKPTRKKYELIGKPILDGINAHIIDQIRSNVAGMEDKKKVSVVCPSKAFADYYRNSQICRMQSSESAERAADEQRLKKIYKNRFYVLRKKYETAGSIY